MDREMMFIYFFSETRSPTYE